MSAANDSTRPDLHPEVARYMEIKARVEALGYQLVKTPEDEDFAVYVVDRATDVVVFIDDSWQPEESRLESEWLAIEEPAASNKATDFDDEETEGTTKYTLMVNPTGDVSVFDLCYSVGAIAESLDRLDNDTDAEYRSGLASALKVVGAQLMHAQGNVDLDDEHKVRRALAIPDSRAAVMNNRLRGSGYSLWCHPSNGTYAVQDGHGRVHLSIVSLGEIESWLEQKGIAREGGAA